jgi:hypothetical protein
MGDIKYIITIMIISPPSDDYFEAPAPYYVDACSQPNVFSWAADGCKYVLGMQSESAFEMTERRTGVLDGLRCSLQTYLSRLLPATTMQSAEPASLPVTCSCCRKVHTAQHGWMNWDDLRLMTTGRGSSHTICEKCADTLYSDVLESEL